jgi:hypothetical protein
MPDEREIFIASQVGQIIWTACDEIVHTYDFVAFGYQAITNIGSQETCCPSY